MKSTKSLKMEYKKIHLDLLKISKDITDSISILVEKKLDLFSSTVNNK